LLPLYALDPKPTKNLVAKRRNEELLLFLKMESVPIFSSVFTKKAQWMKRWIMDNQIRVITENRKFFWVSSGNVKITKNSQKIRLLHKQGIEGPQEHLVVDKKMRG
jgi:hypothetical protein